MTGDDLARAGGVFEDDALIARVNGALRGMWSRLDAVPRDDPFWSRTNHRTTWFKVHDHARACLDRDPSDAVARLALVGFAMRAGTFDGLDLLAEDAAARAGAVHDLIAVTEWVWLEVGVDPGPVLERALLTVGGPALRRLSASGTRAAAAGLAFLDGASFAEAIGRDRWQLLLHALVDPSFDERARECLREDASAVGDLMDAARWWATYRDTDVTGRLRELLVNAASGSATSGRTAGTGEPPSPR
ncbi:hypothetical protein [Dactylosporangium sp. NPDC050588]|uniref:hypothetical protein n=1 Tax=Dactylosporangium sp. NPDC050588 TaxID=3157211 RepID=UPI0033F96593